ncbi:MAG TPA: hypothetical protein V6C97_08495 [Oculatellaceae cyanobacterium]
MPSKTITIFLLTGLSICQCVFAEGTSTIGLELPTGLKIPIALDEPFGDTSEKGDTIRAHVAANVLYDGQIWVPKDSAVTGKLIATQSQPHAHSCDVSFSNIACSDGRSAELHARPVIKKGVLVVKRGLTEIRFDCDNFPNYTAARIAEHRSTKLSFEKGDEFLIELTDPVELVSR